MKVITFCNMCTRSVQKETEHMKYRVSEPAQDACEGGAV